MKLNILILLMAISVIGYSQDFPVKGLSEEEQEAFKALSQYPEDVRSDILEASQYPGVLTRLGQLRSDSFNSFNEMLGDYSEDIHARIYNISRYPELIQAMDSSGGSVEVSHKYADSVRNDMMYIQKHHPQIIDGIAAIQQDVEVQLDALFDMYPKQTEEAYRSLIKHPEVLIIMYKNLHMTALLGDYYRQSPLDFSNEFAMAGVLASEDKEDVGEEESMEKILEELSKRSNQYARSLQETSKAEQEARTNEVYTQPKSRVTVTVGVGYGYSYWYGYPYWYRYPYW